MENILYDTLDPIFGTELKQSDGEYQVRRPITLYK